jgi:hypothetical protein
MSKEEPAPLTVDWSAIERGLSVLDFARRPTSKAAWVARLTVTLIALWFVVRKTSALVGPLVNAHPPPPIPNEEIDDYRFKLPERTRREIFTELATAELAERRRAIQGNTWNGHLWSREDDRGHYERVKVREVAARHKISLSQVYLVLDEGIRSKWPAPDGQPLPATTPPWDPRTVW